MTRSILFFQYLIGISIVFGVSCKPKPQNPGNEISNQLKNSNYDDRIRNIFSFLKEANFPIPDNNCKRYIILQTNLCNACNESKIISAINKLKSDDTTSVFILASHNIDVKKTVIKNYLQPLIFIDSLSNLKKFNLNFLRNLSITTCGNQIVSWKYLY